MIVETGRILKGFAAGARKSRKRFPHQFAVDGFYDVDGMQDDRLARLHRCDLIHFNDGIGKSWDSLCLWAQVAEWLVLHQDQTYDFESLYRLWASLGTDSECRLFFDFFIREMKMHGLTPELDECVICRKPFFIEGMNQKDYVFVIEEGGLSHPQCRAGLSLDGAAVLFLKSRLSESLPALENQTLARASQESLNRVIIPYLEWQMGQAFKSRRVHLKQSTL